MVVRCAGSGIRLPGLNPGPAFPRYAALGKLVQVPKVPFSVRWGIDRNGITGL